MTPVVIALGLKSKASDNDRFSLNQTFEVLYKTGIKINF